MFVIGGRYDRILTYLGCYKLSEYSLLLHLICYCGFLLKEKFLFSSPYHFSFIKCNDWATTECVY